MALDISAETPRVQYTVTSADSTFDYDFDTQNKIWILKWEI